VRSVGSSRFWDAYVQLPVNVKRQARAAYRLFRDNPDHPGLNFKHIVGVVYTARINRHYRVVGARDGNTMVWFWVGPHNECDRLLAQLRRGQ
jgi:hypothetical protein